MVCDMLQTVLLFTNTWMLYRECRQLRLATKNKKKIADALFEYVASGWNCVDAFGIVARDVAVAAHFIAAPAVVEQIGAVGVLANTMSLLQMLQPFQMTGTLIQVIVRTTIHRRTSRCCSRTFSPHHPVS